MSIIHYSSVEPEYKKPNLTLVKTTKDCLPDLDHDMLSVLAMSEEELDAALIADGLDPTEVVQAAAQCLIQTAKITYLPVNKAPCVEQRVIKILQDLVVTITKTKQFYEQQIAQQPQALLCELPPFNSESAQTLMPTYKFKAELQESAKSSLFSTV